MACIGPASFMTIEKMEGRFRPRIAKLCVERARSIEGFHQCGYWLANHRSELEDTGRSFPRSEEAWHFGNVDSSASPGTLPEFS